MQQVKMLRETEAWLSLVAEKAVKFLERFRFSKSVLIREINSTKLLAIVELYLNSQFGSAKYKFAPHGGLPGRKIQVILGNDVAG